MLFKDWKSSASHLKDVRYLSIMAVFIAIKVLVGSAYIPLSESLQIKFSFLAICVEASIIGPVAGMVSGMVTDLIGFMVAPSGPFFPGYTLSAMLTELVYASFLYHKPLSIARITLAKAVNNYVVNVCIGSIWSSMLYGNLYIYYFLRSIVKNTLLLPVEVILLILLFNLLGRTLKARGFLHADTHFPIPFLNAKIK